MRVKAKNKLVLGRNVYQKGDLFDIDDSTGKALVESHLVDRVAPRVAVSDDVKAQRDKETADAKAKTDQERAAAKAAKSAKDNATSQTAAKVEKIGEKSSAGNPVGAMSVEGSAAPLVKKE